MILNAQQSLVLVAVIGIGTLITRALPFMLFSQRRETPEFIIYLGKVIPFAAIGLLIIYCLKNVSLVSLTYGLPEGLAIACTVFLHLFKKNTLLSIGGGTLTYMLLVQFVFVS